MAYARFDASYPGIGKLLKAPYMQKAMRERANIVKKRAVATAPVYRAGPHPGRYKAAFVVTSGVRRHSTERAFGRVTNNSPEALSVEFGTKNNPAHHTLVLALHGLDFVEGYSKVPKFRNREGDTRR